MHRIIKQMGKVNLDNQTKIVIPKKWLTMTPNLRHYKHPLVAPPNLSANLTSLECHEPLSHTYHKSLHQTNED